MNESQHYEWYIPMIFALFMFYGIILLLSIMIAVVDQSNGWTERCDQPTRIVSYIVPIRPIVCFLQTEVGNGNK